MNKDSNSNIFFERKRKRKKWLFPKKNIENA